MADRYWVGGSGNWSDTARWSTSSGGSSGASVPTAGDNAIFNASSDSNATITVTLTGASTCLNLDMSAIDQNLTFTGAFTLSVLGNLSLSATKTIDVTGITSLALTASTTRTITGNSGTLTGGITFNSTNGIWSLQDTFTITGLITHTAGQIAFNGKTFAARAYTTTSTSTRALNFTTASSILSLNTTLSETIFNITSLTGLTITSPSTGLVDIVGSSNVTRTIASLNLAAASAINFRYSSTAGTITATANMTVGNLTINCAGTTVSNIAITVYGSFSYTAGTLSAGTNILTLSTLGGTSNTFTATGGVLDFPITITGGNTGTFTLGSNVTVGSAAERRFTLSQGVLNLSSYILTIYGSFNSSGIAVRTLDFSTGYIDLTLDGAIATTIWDTTTVTSFTVSNSATGSVRIKGSGSLVRSVNTGGLSEANSLSFEFLSTAGTITLTNATSRIKNFIINCAGTTISNAAIALYGNFTHTAGTLSAGTNTLTFSATSGTQTISSVANLDFPITFAGTATYSILSNINIGTTTSRLVNLTTGTIELNSYALTIYGQFNPTGTGTRKIQMSGSGGKIVLSLDTASTVYNNGTVTGFTTDGNVLIQLTGGGAVTKTISAGAGTEAQAISFQLSTTAGTVAFTASNTIKNLTIDNNTFTLSNIAITIYGNLLISGTSPTLTAGTSAWTFGATSSKTITTSGKTLDFPVTFNGVGGTWALQDALTHGAGATARTLTLTNGTLDLNEYTLTIFGGFSSTNTNTRTVDFGTTGKIVLAMAGATLTQIWNTQTGTNLTIIGNNLVEVVGSGTLSRAISASQADIASTTFNFSILTTAGIVTNFGRYNNLTYNCTNTTVSGSPSLFGNLTMVTTVTSSSGQTTMIGSNGTITSNGNTIPFPIIIDTVGGTITLNDALTLLIADATNGALTLTNGTLNLNNFTATLNRFSSTNTNTRSIAFGTSGKILVRGTNDVTSSAIYMDTMDGFSFSGTSNIEANITTAAVTQRIRMGITSGATESNVMNFTLTGTTGTQQLLGSFKNITLNTDAIFTTNTTALCYGNFNHVKVSLTASTGSVTFASTSGTKTITSNGQTILYPIIFDGVGGTWQLQDALSVGNAASVTVTLTNGTLDLNSYTMTIFGIFSSSNSNTRRIQTTGSGGKIVLSLNTTATVWSTPTVTNMTTDGNVLVQLTGGGATVKTINSGALSEANSISFQLSTTAGTVTFTGGNTIKNLTVDNNSFTLSNTSITIYGNLLISGATPTISSGTQTVTFASTGSITITTNGKTLDFPLVFGLNTGGTYTLQDALTVGSTRQVYFGAGTINLNSLTMTVGYFSSSSTGTKVLAHGTNGNLVVTGNDSVGVAFNFLGATNLTYTGTGIINMTASTAKTFNGGGNSFKTLNQGGLGNLSISGDNTYYNITNTVVPCTIIFDSGGTHTFSNFSLAGTSGNYVTIASDLSTPHTLVLLSGGFTGSYFSISKSNATGGTGWYAYDSIDGGNNTGWIISGAASGATSTFLIFFFS